MPHTVPTNDWTSLQQSFESFFQGYGSITLDEHTLSFQSLPHRVSTEFSISRDGTMGASMPLHQIHARFTKLTFDEDARQVTCHAEGMAYTYRIPPQLWPA